MLIEIQVAVSRQDDRAWVVVAAIAAAASSVFAGMQILLARRDANRRAAIELLALVDLRSRELLNLSVVAAQSEIIERWKGVRPSLSSDASTYIAFLNSVDLLAFAVANKLADAALIGDHIATLMRGQVISVTFLTELQMASRDRKVYEHLRRYVIQHSAEGETP